MDLDGSNTFGIPFYGGNGSATTTNSKATSTTTDDSLMSRGSDVSDVTSIHSTTGSRDTRWNPNSNLTEKIALSICQAFERITGEGLTFTTNHMRFASDKALTAKQKVAVHELLQSLTRPHASRRSIGQQIRDVGDLFESKELELEDPSADYPTFYNACLGLEGYWKTEGAIPMANAEDTEGDELFIYAARVGSTLSERLFSGETHKIEWAKQLAHILYPSASREGDQRT